ncbi:citramalate synthase [Microbacterium sp. LWH7-1.2]|uniref:citramalate synthase n=1 Tax=Microbacterium sp. LWH7-1.2 TaxID=3135257 RepID=UPI003139718A
MTAGGLPRVVIVEEGMRDGLQIESSDVTVDERVRLLDTLSRSGLQRIVVGAFVSPRWSPSMAGTDEVIRRMHVEPGVEYTALALNAKGVELQQEFIPPLTRKNAARTIVHACDVFVQRNTNRDQAAEIAAWPGVIGRAVRAGAETATIALNAGFGSNWLGDFSHEERMSYLERQHDLWTAAGVEVDTVWLGDPMGWNTPGIATEMISAIRARWPAVRTFHFHLHNQRGAAIVTAYAAIMSLGAEHTAVFDTAIGGIGGCPYCGNGRATGMIPTEDFVDMLEEMGIDTGVDRAVLIEAARLLSEILGRQVPGKLSQAGPRPRGADLYPMDMPFVETFAEASHFVDGPAAYAHQRSPWPEPIHSDARDAVESTLRSAE